jgi:hypothetical protein
MTGVDLRNPRRGNRLAAGPDAGCAVPGPRREGLAVAVKSRWMNAGAVIRATAFAFTLTIAACNRSTHITVHWNDNSGGAASTIVERKTGMTGVYRPIATVAPGVTELKDDPGGTPGTLYCYRVKAINAKTQESSGYSNEVCK